MRSGAPELIRLLSTVWLPVGLVGAKAAVRWVSQHTGVPALIVAATLVVGGYRVLRRSMRFAIEVAVVAAALLAASHLGWIRW